MRTCVGRPSQTRTTLPGGFVCAYGSRSSTPLTRISTRDFFGRHSQILLFAPLHHLKQPAPLSQPGHNAQKFLRQSMLLAPSSTDTSPGRVAVQLPPSTKQAMDHTMAAYRTDSLTSCCGYGHLQAESTRSDTPTTTDQTRTRPGIIISSSSPALRLPLYRQLTC